MDLSAYSYDLILYVGLKNLKLGFICLFIDLIAEISLKPDTALVAKIQQKVVQHLSNDANRFKFLTWKIWRVKSEVTTKLRFWQLTDLGCPTPKKVAPMSYIISNHGSSSSSSPFLSFRCILILPCLVFPYPHVRISLNTIISHPHILILDFGISS